MLAQKEDDKVDAISSKHGGKQGGKKGKKSQKGKPSKGKGSWSKDGIEKVKVESPQANPNGRKSGRRPPGQPVS